MATRVMVSFSEELLAEVDRIASEEHRSRSELVREAIRLYVETRQDRRRPGDDPRVQTSIAAQDALSRLSPGTDEDSSVDIRQWRETRDTSERWAGREAKKALTQADRQIALEFRRRLAAVMPVLDLRVFGSRARGDAAPDSDLDVFIEVEEITPELHQRISEIAWEVGFEMDRVISTVVVTRDQLEQGAMGASPLVLNVEREGVRP